jgi:hypothetical protein
MATNTANTDTLSITEWLHFFSDRLPAYLHYLGLDKERFPVLIPVNQHHGGFIIEGTFYIFTGKTWEKQDYDYDSREIDTIEISNDATSI